MSGCKKDSKTPSIDYSEDRRPPPALTRWFARRIVAWQRTHGRQDLPWQRDPTPYRVWVSEIMLQQTRVETVIPYFRRFMARFPRLEDLAAAPLDEVLQLWAGLGYYARARHLHRAAQLACTRHGGLPLDLEALQALPGIGRSTAGAILALAGGRRAAILDGNVKRVLCRFHAVAGWPGTSAVARRLWQLAEWHTPHRSVARYTQGIMDLGALVCTRRNPHCDACPLAARCRARLEDAPARYPASRPRRRLPERHAALLVLENARRQILLERRPPAGIWGGLWSLPECPHRDPHALRHWCREVLACEVEILHIAPEIQHSFTHYHFHITPVHAQLTHRLTHPQPPADRVMEGPHRVWYNVDQLQRQALAAPVKRILQRLLIGTPV